MTSYIIEENANPVEIAQECRKERINRAECPQCQSSSLTLTMSKRRVLAVCRKCGHHFTVGG